MRSAAEPAICNLRRLGASGAVKLVQLLDACEIYRIENGGTKSGGSAPVDADFRLRAAPVTFPAHTGPRR